MKSGNDKPLFDDGLQAFLLWVMMILCLTSLGPQDGWLFYLPLVSFVLSSALLVKLLLQRQLDPRLIAALVGAAISYVAFKVALVFLGNHIDNPIPSFTALLGALLAVKPLTPFIEKF